MIDLSKTDILLDTISDRHIQGEMNMGELFMLLMFSAVFAAVVVSFLNYFFPDD